MMFFINLFTSKRGALAKIWLAAHWERKLTKAHVFECNLESIVKEIISPQMNIGLRTSGHLLLGVVRIFSRKAKYLLADCNGAFLKINVTFRPGLTDLPEDAREATAKAITLTEDFTSFDSPMPQMSDLNTLDHFSLNQSRAEEITLKEDLGNSFLNFVVAGEESPAQPTVLDVSFQSLARGEDAFGDEDKGLDLLVSMEERKRLRRKRKLVVDRVKELSSDTMKNQIACYADLVAPLDMAPPTRTLMQWKESGGANNLFSQMCTAVISPQIKECENRSDFTPPELPTEDSLFVHPSAEPPDTQSTQSVMNRQEFEERRITWRAQRLHRVLKSCNDTTVSLRALCAGNNRSQAANTFSSLLVLKKQEVVQLHQEAPYQDILVTPGTRFFSF
ncbi:double-strand-break repair protein rad21-like protein 1 [Neosynchiropus ocellatus]